MSNELAIKFANCFGWQTTYCVLATFTFISGFFGANNRISTWQDVGAYYKKRLLRIYPLYALASVSLVLCHYNSWESLTRYLLGLGCFTKPYPATIWFVSMLLIFYFVTPLLLKCSTKRRITFFLLLQIVFFMLVYWWDSDIRLIYYWPFYCLGICFKQKKLHFKFFEGHNNWLIIAVFIAYAVLGMNIGENFTILTFVCCFLFIYSTMNIFSKMSNLINYNKMIAFISYSSMSAYLFHRMFFYIIKMLGGTYKPVMAFFVYLPCVFILGGTLQRVYDNLIIKIMKCRSDKIVRYSWLKIYK